MIELHLPKDFSFTQTQTGTHFLKIVKLYSGIPKRVNLPKSGNQFFFPENYILFCTYEKINKGNRHFKKCISFDFQNSDIRFRLYI